MAYTMGRSGLVIQAVVWMHTEKTAEGEKPAHKVTH